MILKELIASVEKTPENEEWVNLETIGRDLSLYDYFVDGTDLELKCYFTKAKWLCTDSMVGIRAYYFKDELVCISSQPGRKYPETFEWVSVEAKQKVRDWLITKMESFTSEIEVIDWEQNVSSWVLQGENWRKHVESAKNAQVNH